MKIYSCSPEMSVDRMYCPSTDEVIFAPGYEEINENADAFIAYWHGEVLDQPEIRDPKLLEAWEKYFEKWDELMEESDPFEIVEKFLKSYRNPNWIVYECTFYGMACGPTSTIVYYVVKKNTIIQEDPNYDEEAEEEEMERYNNMSEDEFTQMVIGKQIGAILRAGEKEEKNANLQEQDNEKEIFNVQSIIDANDFPFDIEITDQEIDEVFRAAEEAKKLASGNQKQEE